VAVDWLTLAAWVRRPKERPLPLGACIPAWDAPGHQRDRLRMECLSTHHYLDDDGGITTCSKVATYSDCGA